MKNFISNEKIEELNKDGIKLLNDLENDMKALLKRLDSIGNDLQSVLKETSDITDIK